MNEWEKLYKQASEKAAEAKALFADPDADHDRARALITEAEQIKARADGLKAAAALDYTPPEPEPNTDGVDTVKGAELREQMQAAGVSAGVIDAVLKSLDIGAPEGEFTKAGGTKKEYRFNDFLRAVRYGNTKALRAMGAERDTEETKDLDEMTGADGGYLVPTQFLAELLMVPDSAAVVRPRARVIPMNHRSLVIPALDQGDTPSYYWDLQYYGGVYAKWEDELGTKNETEPDFKQIELVAYKLAGYTQASDELLADSAIGVESLLYDLFRGAVTMREDFAFLRGTGVGMPVGVLNSGALLTQNRATANQIEYRDLARMMDQFLPSCYGNAIWVVDLTALPELLTMEDTAGNNVFIPNASGGVTQAMPGSIFGMPVKVTEKLPALGSTGDVLLADFSYYLIGDRQQTSIAASIHYAFIQDKTTWRFVHRVDGQPWLDEPIYIDTTNTASPFVALHANTTS